MTYVLTGAGSGIGAAIAARLIERNNEVWLLARTPERATELASAVPGARTLVADLSEPDRLAEHLKRQQLPASVDGLLHVAGVVELGGVEELDVRTWDRLLAVNLVAPAELTRLLLPALRRGRGQVLFLNSGSGLRAHGRWAAYAASKHGLRALADALREEETAHGIRVVSVYPGKTATPMQLKVRAQEQEPYDPLDWMDAESVATAVLAALGLPRDASVTDLTIRPTSGK